MLLHGIEISGKINGKTNNKKRWEECLVCIYNIRSFFVHSHLLNFLHVVHVRNCLTKKGAKETYSLYIPFGKLSNWLFSWRSTRNVWHGAVWCGAMLACLSDIYNCFNFRYLSIRWNGFDMAINMDKSPRYWSLKTWTLFLFLFWSFQLPSDAKNIQFLANWWILIKITKYVAFSIFLCAKTH